MSRRGLIQYHHKSIYHSGTLWILTQKRSVSATIEDCAKDGGEGFLPRCIAFELPIFNDSTGIRLKNVVHRGKKFLAAIFRAIVYCTTMNFVTVSVIPLSHSFKLHCLINFNQSNEFDSLHYPIRTYLV